MQHQVRVAPALVQDRRRLQQLLVGEHGQPGEIANEHRIGPEQLAQARIGVVVDHHGPDHPAVGREEGVEHEALFPQEHLHLGKQRLADVHRQKFDLRLDHQGGLQPRHGVLQHQEFGALDVDLDHFDAHRLHHVVEPDGIELLGRDDAPPVGEAVEETQHGRVGLQDRRHARRLAEVQRVAVSVADHVGQVGLGRPLDALQLGERVAVRLEADDVRITWDFKQLLIGRLALERTGPPMSTIFTRTFYAREGSVERGP